MPTIDTGNTAWVLACAALVLLMTPGLAFFYAGMARGKHALAMIMQNFVCIGVVSVAWVLGVYSLAFGAGNTLIGDLTNFGLQNATDSVPGYVGPLALTIPPIVFIAFQLMFAIITPALITGAIADRIKFGSFVAFVSIWIIVVYAPVAHWVFSPNGWLFQLGAEDFAGGTVVHANAGAAALALVIVLGKRIGWPKKAMRPHNMPFVMLGTGLLWFGWFGFNAGSALGANQLAGFAFFNTGLAAAVAMIAWLTVEKIRRGKSTALGAASGAVAGLVAITPACGFVSPLGALAIGAIAGVVCCFAISLKDKFKYKFDDAMDVVGVHLVGGVTGALLIGFFGNSAVAGANGLFYGGDWSLLWHQAIAVGVVVGYSFVATLIIGYVLKWTIGLRVTEEDELVGTDWSQHGETAYDLAPTAG